MTADHDFPRLSTIGDILLRSAAAHPDADALVFPDARLTYRELGDGATDAARSLAALDVGPGDHVGLLMQNGPEFVRVFFGALLLGAIVVPINTRFRDRELAHVIDHSDIAVLVVSGENEEHVDYVARLYSTFDALAEQRDPFSLQLPQARGLRSIVGVGSQRWAGLVSGSDFGSLAERVSTERVDALRRRVRLRGPAMILFTSGTTALPKGCVLTHEAVVRSWLDTGRRLRITAADRVYAPLPLFHLGGIGPMLFTFDQGATLLNQPHFDAAAGLDLLVRERATWLYTMFPPIATGLIRHPSFGGRDLSSVTAVINVAPDETSRLIGRAFPGAANLQGQFGMTECGGSITCNDPADPPTERVATSGRPLPGMEVQVIHPATGMPLPLGEDGELLVRGVGLFEGYYKDPEATAAAVDVDGWLHTGDRGHLDERGRVRYVGRSKEMLKVGGENVAPAEIESHLASLPAVKLAQVVGVPDPRLDEVPVAVIEIAPGESLTAEEAIAHCVGRIASFKVPRHVVFVTEWPTSATKVQKNRLRDQVLAMLPNSSTPESRRRR